MSAYSEKWMRSWANGNECRPDRGRWIIDHDLSSSIHRPLSKRYLWELFLLKKGVEFQERLLSYYYQRVEAVHKGLQMM